MDADAGIVFTDFNTEAARDARCDRGLGEFEREVRVSVVQIRGGKVAKEYKLWC